MGETVWVKPCDVTTALGSDWEIRAQRVDWVRIWLEVISIRGATVPVRSFELMALHGQSVVGHMTK